MKYLENVRSAIPWMELIQSRVGRLRGDGRNRNVPGGSVAITPVSPSSNDNFDDTLHSVPPPGCCRIPLESWYRAKIHLSTVERAP
ncbi:hypothetical protein HZH68_015620 [Vespula germanica]|uniref:Uncharacterized protein n=1 Tax=Vespula germanica TaxID=30212 RepID=A0A834J720_VESGE|nr:hypothetical protein HZH68_015620 [Vespula germanica]